MRKGSEMARFNDAVAGNRPVDCNLVIEAEKCRGTVCRLAAFTEAARQNKNETTARSREATRRFAGLAGKK